MKLPISKKESVEAPECLFVVILSGSKVSNKICVIENLLEKADKVLIGGGGSAVAINFGRADKFSWVSLRVETFQWNFLKEKCCQDLLH